MGAGSVVMTGGIGAWDGLGTEGWRGAKGTTNMGWGCERVMGKWRDDRRSMERGEGIWPVTAAMASQGEASGSCITALGGG